MKTITSIYLFALLATSTSNANRTDGPEGRGAPNGPDIEIIVANLQIEHATAKKLKALMRSFHQEIKSLRDQNKKNREQHRKDLLTVLGYENL